MPGLTLEQLQSMGAVKKGTGVPLEQLKSKQPSFVEGVSEKIGERVKSVEKSEEAFARGEQPFVESALQTAGQIAGGVFDIGGEALISALKLVPGFIKEPVKDVAEETLKSPIGQAGLKAISSGIEAYRGWKAGNPRAAKDLESVVNIVSLLPVGAGTKIVGREALATTGELAGKVAKPLEESLAKQTLDATLDIIRPQLTKIQKQAALQEGRGVVTGKILPRRFEKITVKPTMRELETANILDGIVTKSNNPIENIAKIDNEIVKLATSVQEGLAENNIIFNKNQIRSVLDKAKTESRVVFGTDATLQNNYNAIVDEMMRQIETQPKNVSGLLQARKNFDKLIENKFPKILSNPLGDAARQNAIRDVRRSVNDFIAEKLPEGNLFKARLRQQTLMYDAIKNISQKTASSVDASTIKKVMQALRQNPLVAGVTGGILTYGALMGMFTNPLVIGTLLTGGTLKFGKTIITSKTLKSLLIRSLRFLETQGHKAGNSESVQAINAILKKIDEGEISAGLSIEDVSKGVYKGETTLLTEALKYKTADEFVKAQQKAFHGTSVAGLDEIGLGSGPRSNSFMGTTREVKSGAVFFTPDKSVADFFAQNRTEFMSDLGKKGTPTTYERYLNIKNPLDLTGKNLAKTSAALDKLGIDIEGKLTGMQSFNRDLETLIADKEVTLDELWKLADDPEIVAQLKKAGYDGAIFKETGNRGTSYAIFDPKNAFTKSQLTDIWEKANKK